MGDIALGTTSLISAEMGQVLGRDPLGPDEDFFVCGGDSVLAVQLITRLAARFRSDDEETTDRLRSSLLMTVFDEATPRSLASVVGTPGG
nr:phosphopantetheine-binding protein [Micromonospora sp. DSM 115978]